MDTKTKSNSYIQSVSRAIEILKLFETNEELGVTEISKGVGLHKSTAFGLVTTLELHHFLEKNESNDKYKLGVEIFKIGTKVNSGLRHITYPYLEKIVGMYQETVNLVVLESHSVVYLEKVESSHSMRISTAIGETRQLYCTAVGKALLSCMSEKQIQEYLDSIVLIKHTPNTIVDQNKLLNLLLEYRQLGYAMETEELERGLSCVAAPIFNHVGKAFAAISVSGPTSRMEESFRNKIAATS
jgi:IclR family KDG regulon transcriptional repressor